MALYSLYMYLIQILDEASLVYKTACTTCLCASFMGVETSWHVSFYEQQACFAVQIGYCQ